MIHLFFLLFICISPLTTFTTNTTILDINGHPLQTATNYFILPVFRGGGGGLTLKSKNSTTSCPLYVAQDNLEVSNGLPLKLYPVNPKEKSISLSGDLNVVFDASTICVASTGWRLTSDEVTGRLYVGLGGRVGNPGRETISNWFKIEKAGSGSGKYDYKIVFCPGVCNTCRPVCGELGVFFDKDGRRLLGLNREQTLLVKFKKA